MLVYMILLVHRLWPFPVVYAITLAHKIGVTLSRLFATKHDRHSLVAFEIFAPVQCMMP